MLLRPATIRVQGIQNPFYEATRFTTRNLNMPTAQLSAPRRKTMDRLTSEMPPALRKAYVEIHKLFAQYTLKDVQGRYAIGKRVKLVRDGDGKSTYGTGAMRKLAVALHRSEEFLRQYAMVADVWTAREVQGIVKRPDRKGNRLTWSHLIEIAGITCSKEREALLEETRAHCYSVRELKGRIADHGDDTDEHPDEATDRPANFHAGVRKMAAQAEILVNNAELWKTAVFERVKAADPATFDEGFRAMLVHAQELQAKAEAVCRENREGVEACLALVTTALDGRTRKAKKKSA
jgi:hypothetical protein